MRDPVLFLLHRASYYLHGVDMMLRHWVPKNTPVDPKDMMSVYTDTQKPMTIIQTAEIVNINKQYAKELTQVAELLQDAGF